MSIYAGADLSPTIKLMRARTAVQDAYKLLESARKVCLDLDCDLPTGLRLIGNWEAVLVADLEALIQQSVQKTLDEQKVAEAA